MNKTELVGKVAEKAGLTKKDTEKAINGFIEVVQESLSEGDTVALLGFGTFLARERPAREGRNPRTGEPIQIPAAKVPVFRPGRGLRNAVSGQDKSVSYTHLDVYKRQLLTVSSAGLNVAISKAVAERWVLKKYGAAQTVFRVSLILMVVLGLAGSMLSLIHILSRRCRD